MGKVREGYDSPPGQDPRRSRETWKHQAKRVQAECDTVGLETDCDALRVVPQTVICLLEVLDHMTSVSPVCFPYVSKVTCKLVENVNLSRELEISCHVHCVKPSRQSRT